MPLVIPIPWGHISPLDAYAMFCKSTYPGSTTASIWPALLPLDVHVAHVSQLLFFNER